MLKYTVTIGKTQDVVGTIVDVDALEITLNKSEELDFGVFTIPATTRFENFQILDRVDITVTDGINTTVYDPFVIIGDKVEPVSKLGYFKHTITIIENVHKFEKILSGSLYITQPLSENKKSLFQVLQHIRNVIPFERTSLLSSTRLFNIDSKLETYLDGIEAPQFFFNGGSLRDMLNGVSSYVNAIARLEDSNNLIFSFYDEILSSIGIEDDIIYKTLSNQTDKWSSTIESTLENAVSSDDTSKSVVVHPSPDSWVSLRSRQLKLTDDSFEIRVPYPIERITKVFYKMFIKLNFSEVTSLPSIGDTSRIYKVTSSQKYYRYRFAQSPFEQDGFVELVEYVDFEIIRFAIEEESNIRMYYYADVTDQILILDQWKRLDLDRISVNDRDRLQLKINSFYFEIGGKTITNTQLGGVFDDVTSFTAFHRRALVSAGFNQSIDGTGGVLYPENSISEVSDGGVRDFRISYVPYFGTKIRSEKSNIFDHPYNTQIAINQAERIVSADRLLSNIYGLAQRTGQDEILVKRYHTDLTKSFELGDITSDGFVVASIHYTYYIKYFVVNYQFTKNFNRFSNRIALSQENRPFDIGLGSKTTNRKVIYTEYIELDTKQTINSSLVRKEGVDVFANTLRTNKQSKNKPIHFGTIYDGQMIDVNEGDGLLVKTIPFSDGNTLNFHWGFDDIIAADDQIFEDAYFSDKSRFLQSDARVTFGVNANKMIRYTNSLGELNTFELAFYSELDATTYDSSLYPVIPLPQTPLIGGHSIGDNLFDSFTVEKDKSESLTMNYQLAVVPHYDYHDKIFVGKDLIRRNNLITKHPVNTQNYFLWGSTTETYNGLDLTKAKGEIITNSYYTLGLFNSTDSDSGFKVSVTIPNISSYKSWGIADNVGNLYLSANIDSEIIDEVYFNFRNRRSGQSYTFDGRDIQISISPFITLQSGLNTVIVNIVDRQQSEFFEVTLTDITNNLLPVKQITTTSQSIFSNLQPITNYEVSVVAVFNGIKSTPTVRRIFTDGIPRKIENVYTRVELNNIRVYWNVFPEARGYQIQYRKSSEPESAALSEFSGTGTSNKLILNLVPNTIYIFRVRGFDLEYTGEYSEEALGVVTTDSFYSVSAIPTSNNINISWTEIPTSSGYQLRFKEASATNYFTFNFFDPEFTSYNLTGLSPTTQYQIAVRIVFTYEGESIFTDWVERFVTTTVQAPPGDLAAPVLSNELGYPTTFQASWVVTNNNDVGVNVFYDFYNTSTNTTTTARGTIAANSSVTATTTGSEGQTRHIAAQFKQTNFNDSIVSTNSQTLLVSTPMTAPDTVSISDITVSSAKATWSFVNDASNGYLIEIRTSPDDILVEQRVTGIFVVVTTFENLGPGTSYYVRVLTIQAGSRPNSPYTNSAVFTTDTIAGAPTAPSGLQILSSVVDGDQVVINLGWTDNATNEIGYRVYYRLGVSGGFTNISGNLAANTTTYQDVAPDGGTVFYYVAAYNANGESVSNTVQY